MQSTVFRPRSTETRLGCASSGRGEPSPCGLQTVNWGPPHEGRAGFTIMEMLIVLAVLALALAIIFPSVTRLFRDQRMLRAVEQLQGRLATAHNRAVEDQVNYQFRFEPNGRRFVVFPEPEVGEEDDEAAQEAAGRQYRYSGELMEPLQFDPGDWGSSSGNVPDEWFQGMADASTLAGIAWSEPLLFYPDGTSTGGEIAVHDDRNNEVRFSVRPVTGGVTVSPIQGRSQ